MPLSTETLQNLNAIGLTSARRLDGLAAYPPYPYTLLRNATLTVAANLGGPGFMRLMNLLREYERNGVLVHPKSAAFLLVMIDAMEGATARPMMLSRDDEDEDDSSQNRVVSRRDGGKDELPVSQLEVKTGADDESADETTRLARLIGESPSEIHAVRRALAKSDDKRDESDS